MLTPEEIAAILARPTTSVPTAGKVLGISGMHAYRCAKTGEIPTLKLGRRVLVPTAALAAMLKIPASA
jgi:excisionase family DNA binding protein